jgi:hypothetical protein
LSQDPQSSPLLHEAMGKRAEPVAIRRAAALSLRALDPTLFQTAAAVIVVDQTEDDLLRTSLAIALDLMDAPQLAEPRVSAAVRQLSLSPDR